MKVALDSDILRDLVYFSRLTKDGVVFKYNNPLNIDNVTVRLYFDDFAYLYQAIKSYQVELHVSKYVYNEVNHDENVVEFVQKYCHRNFDVNEKKIEVLAQAYSSDYTFKGEKMLAPMNKNYVAAINKTVPTNDCYIMADATVNLCNLLTNNVYDFVFDKYGDAKNHRRIEGITYINKSFGYKKKGIDNDFIPQPIVIKKLVKYLENLRKRQTNLVSKTYHENVKKTATLTQEEIISTNNQESSNHEHETENLLNLCVDNI